MHKISVGESPQGWTFTRYPGTEPIAAAPRSLFLERVGNEKALSLMQLHNVAAILLGYERTEDLGLNEVGFLLPVPA